MALLGNYHIFNKNPIQNTGGDSLSGIVGLRYNWNQSGISNGRFYGENWIVGVSNKCGVPNGYSAPYSWKLPPKIGGLGSNVGAIGSGSFSGSGALGMNIESTIDGLGEITNANLGLILSAVATLSGLGGLSADVVGALNAAATLAGNGDMSGSLGALAGAVATLSGTATMNNDITALAHLSADIYVNQSEASVQQIVDGVWNALATNYNTSGTMGEAVQTGGGGGSTAAQIWSYGTRTLTESAGLSTEEHDKLFSLENSTGGGGFSSQAIQTSIYNAKKEIIDKIETDGGITRTIVDKNNNETNSHIDIAKGETIDTIKETENEICSDIIRKTSELKQDNVTTRNLVRQKTNKIDENTKKLADRQDEIQKEIDDEFEEIEDALKQVDEEEIIKALEEADAEHEKNIIEALNNL